jgi:hypothetical protein
MKRIGGKKILTAFGARLALLALALQLVLSFGHFHPLPANGSSASVTLAVTGGQNQDPIDPLGSLASDDCAICASIAAFAAADLPQPLAYAAPLLAVRLDVGVEPRLAQTETPYRLFQTRAPPAA